MRKRIFFLVPAALLTMSANVLATDSTGRYFEYVTSVAETVLADGRTVVISNAKQQAISDKLDDPFNNVSGDCTGRMVLSSKGEVMSGSGTWSRTHVFSDGAMGSYTSTYTRK
jgi:hypothetical protein